MKKLIKKIPVLGPFLLKLKRKAKPIKFDSTEKYWIERYESGGNSGQGSYEKYAEHKGEVINDFIKEHNIKSVIEFGSGDGNQLSYFAVDNYIGFEVSPAAIDLCKSKYKEDTSKSFYLVSEFKNQRAEFTMSLDVVYCLAEEEVYLDHMKSLFEASDKYVLVFAYDHDKNDALLPHMCHRKFTDWVGKNRPDFEQIKFVKNKFSGEEENVNVSDFYFFEKKT